MRKLVLAVVAMVFGWSSGASALPIVIKNIATGIDDLTGNKIDYASPDADYQIYEGIVQGSGSTPVTYAAPSESGGWIEDGASAESRWVSTAGSNNATPLTTFFFQTTFDVSEADWNSARIEDFRFAADNQLIGLSINGTSVFSASPVPTGDFDYENFQSLGTIGSGLFQEGSNTILFAVYNGQHEPGTNPMGFRAEGVVTAGIIPEPSTALLLSIGLVGMASRRRV